MTKGEIARLQDKLERLGHYDRNEFADAPPWSDEQAQLRYIGDYLAGGWYLTDWSNVPPRPSAEQLAVDAALRGNLKMLAELIRQPNPQLAPATCN